MKKIFDISIKNGNLETTYGSYIRLEKKYRENYGEKQRTIINKKAVLYTFELFNTIDKTKSKAHALSPFEAYVQYF